MYRLNESLNDINDTIGSDVLTTTAQTHSGAINELNKKIIIEDTTTHDSYIADDGIRIPVTKGVGKIPLNVYFNVFGQWRSACGSICKVGDNDIVILHHPYNGTATYLNCQCKVIWLSLL